MDLSSQDPIPPLRWAAVRERPPGLRLSFSVLATSAISPKRAKTTAMEFYRRRGIADPVLFGEREARVENTTRYNPENGSLLTEPRSFNLMFETHTGALDEHSSGRVMSVGPAGATGPPSEPGYSGYSGYSGHVAPLEPVKFDSTLTSSQKQPVDVNAKEIAIRHRADRQSVSQRNQPAQFYLSFARVRADGVGILLPGGGGNETARILEGTAAQVL